MILRNVEVIITGVEHKQGISGPAKGSKPYSFFICKFVDVDYNKFEGILPRNATVDGVVYDWLLEAKNLKAYMDLEVKSLPTARGVSLSILEINQE